MTSLSIKSPSRIFTNFWTIFLMAFIVFNFARANYYEYLVGPLSALYIGILTLHVGTKEFDRWHKTYVGRYSGETFVFIWSVIIAALFTLSIFLGREYKIPSEIVATYIAVLSIFAITNKSKRIHDMQTKKRKDGL